MSNGIQGKVVVITGASSGLGESTARHLGKLGATVILGARRKDRLDAIVKDIEAKGGKALAMTADVTKRSDVESLVKKAVDTFGKIDVLVNNAGIMPIAPLALLKVDEWDRMIDLNIKGVLYGIAAALPQMKKQQSGHFINIASVFGVKVFAPGGTVYCATKAAVRSLTEGLRMEVHGDKIRTTIIDPGAVESELKESTSDQESSKALKQLYEASAISAESIARAIAYAIEQPADVDVNEIVVRPVVQDFWDPVPRDFRTTGDAAGTDTLLFDGQTDTVHKLPEDCRRFVRLLEQRDPVLVTHWNSAESAELEEVSHRD